MSTLTETCAACAGQGTIHETWDCGAGVDTRCDFCNGTGEVPLEMIVKPTKTDVLNEALMEVIQRKVEEAERRLEAQLNKEMFKGDVDGSAVQS